MHVVFAGHVDHGKSTVIGRLLADTGSLPKGKVEAVRALCEKTSRPFEYAFLLDALKDEQAQGITIDTARVFFRSAARDYLILDAPGHVEFLKNMVTGASHAEAALLVIDAREGIRENSRRHGYLLGLLGIRQLAVLVNKMDLVDYREAVFNEICVEYGRFLAEIGLKASWFIPVAARDGHNLVRSAACLAWYDGPTVLEALDAFTAQRPSADGPLRLPVQDVYKFTEDGDARRIVAGTVETGRIRPGDEIVFRPSGKKSRVKTIEAFNRSPPPTVACAGMATGITLQDQIYVTRGEVACLDEEPEPSITTRLRVSLFWMGKRPLEQGTDYLLKIGTARAPMRVERIHRVLNVSIVARNGRNDAVRRHEVAECTLQLSRAVAVDLGADLPATGRFVVVEDYEIRGGGIVLEALPDRHAWVRDKVLLRDYKWDSSFIPPERRAVRYGQEPTLVLVTGPRAVDRKGLARELEARLFREGLVVYFLGIGNVVYGVDADLERDRASRAEHVRRLGEVANILLDAGVILVVSAAELTSDELHVIRTSVGSGRIVTSWVGDRSGADIDADLFLDTSGDLPADTARLRQGLDDVGAFTRHVDGKTTLPFERRRSTPAVLWFTGLSGSGKSSVADWVAGEVRRRGHPVERLDGDAIRHLFPGTGFTRDEREAHIRRVGFLASKLEQHGVFVVASFVSPHEASREFVRTLCRSFVEIYVSTPIEECERRDAKGLYARARRGEIEHFTGISDPYEVPQHPDLVIDTTRLSTEAAGRMVLRQLDLGRPAPA